ncbi:hypothetical protein J3U57_12085, partial [Gilliamella sp. B3464]|uniref:hypothetical protein n=1 Tax=unclassified Gilliamella TaxID=2685620 RepID=UPI00226A2AAC
MPKALSNLISTLGEKAVINNMLSDVSHNRYTLTIEALGSAISVLEVSSDEALNQPWHYRISFTSS